MSDRYFADEPIALGRVVLTGAEAHHLIHVMRASPGMEVVLFDGGGAEFLARVEEIGRREVVLLALSRHEANRELAFDLTLGVALPKGDRQKWLIEKAVELGVTRVVPLRTERAVAQPVDQTLSRLRRSVVEASKQCGRNRLMQVGDPQEWSAFIASSDGWPCRLLAHPPGSATPGQELTAHCGLSLFSRCINEIASISPSDAVLLAVGPEGGFTEGEVALATADGRSRSAHPSRRNRRVAACRPYRPAMRRG
jgi:16S rRNA (uracil1498-N3)-methyltransferase